MAAAWSPPAPGGVTVGTGRASSGAALQFFRATFDHEVGIDLYYTSSPAPSLPGEKVNTGKKLAGGLCGVMDK